MAAAHMNLQRYQQPVWGTLDRVSRNCLVAATIIGVIVMLTALIVPRPEPHSMSIEEMPERFAQLILERPEAKPIPVAPTPQATYEAPKEEIAKVEKPKPEVAKVTPKERPVQRKERPKVAEDKGKQGREQARVEVTQNLQEVSGSLDKVLGALSKALPASGSTDRTANKKSKRVRRGVRTGRATTQLAAVNNVVNDLAEGDALSSGVASEGISIVSVTDLTVAGGSGDAESSGGMVGSSGGGGDIRSSQSLLAVVKRYAPGIQFCYENELKKSPALRGKMIVSLTVEADGRVSSVILVEDSLASQSVSSCVLAQMQGWKFPAIAEGVVTFKTPFVFTPPE